MIFIESQAVLDQWVSKIASSPWAAVDTEADSLHHYSEKLSLVQVTVGEEDVVIDPLIPLNLQKLLDVLAEKELLFQAADSDIRLLKKTYTFKPKRIFDTMIAAQVLGYPKMGLVDLAEKHCGLRLSKAEQKADWSKRPLEAKLLTYAANDTHYLKTIRDAMETELKEAGRLSWHRQICDKLLQTLENLKPQDNDSSLDWQIKGSKELKGLALTVLKELWHWREKVAKEKDRPPFKVLNSEYLVQMARWVSEHPGADIAEWKEAPRNIKGEHRETMNHLIKRCAEMTPAEYTYPERIKPKVRWTELDTRLLTALKSAREKISADLKVHPSLLATNALLEAIVVAKPKDSSQLESLTAILPWQVEVAGETFLGVLSSTK